VVEDDRRRVTRRGAPAALAAAAVDAPAAARSGSYVIGRAGSVRPPVALHRRAIVTGGQDGPAGVSLTSRFWSSRSATVSARDVTWTWA